MARRPTGQLYVVRTKGGARSYGVRFRHQGKRHYRTLGHSADGFTKRDAERALDELMARVRLGQWDPNEGRAPAPADDAPLTFEEFSREWYERRRTTGGRNGRGLSGSGEADLAWQLDHLRAWFDGMALADISVEEVERFAHAKRTQGGLSPTSVNKFLRTLRAILRTAVRYGRLDRNPAEDVRVHAPRFRGSHLDRAEQITALLDAAGELDAAGRLRRGHGRALLAVLTLGGLRIDEALSLRWADVDLASGTLRVRRSKTDAGERAVDLLPLLRDELADLAARRRGDRHQLVFATSTGGKESASNVRRRLLAVAAERADERLAEDGGEALPERLTPHSLRRTFASVLVALGEDPAYVMAQMGHTSPNLTLSVYAKAMHRRDGERDRLRALVHGSEGQGEGNSSEVADLLRAGADAA